MRFAGMSYQHLHSYASTMLRTARLVHELARNRHTPSSSTDMNSEIGPFPSLIRVSATVDRRCVSICSTKHAQLVPRIFCLLAVKRSKAAWVGIICTLHLPLTVAMHPFSSIQSPVLSPWNTAP